MGKEKLIPISALIVLLIACSSTVYVYATQVNSEFIKIDNQDYTIDQLFYIAEKRTIDDYSGIALDDLIKKVGVSDYENKEYTIIASDGYQKTVQWDNLKNGLITKEGQSIFSDLPKAFRVKDIVEIEVN